MLVIKDTSVVPYENWKYFVSATNTTISTPNYGQLYPLVVQHCKSNNVEPPTQQVVINYMCNNLNIPCYEGNVPLINRFTLGIPNPPRPGCCG